MVSRLLSRQLKRAEEGLSAAHRFMTAPSLEAGRRFEEMRAAAAAAADAVMEALAAAEPFREGPSRDVLFRLARALGRALDATHEVVRDMLQLRVDSDVFFREMSRAGHEACRYLERAWRTAPSKPRRAASDVVRAGKWADRIARIHKEAESDALNNPAAPERIKTRGAYRHFSDIAESLGDASDLIGDALVESEGTLR